MSASAASSTNAAGDHHGEHKHSEKYYVKIWALLLILLAVSIIGPMFGHKLLTLVTAFGIAIVKAFIVAAKFMHLDIEKRYIHFVLYTMLLLVVVFYSGVAADIMNNEGKNWVNQANKHQIEIHKGYEHEVHHGE